MSDTFTHVTDLSFPTNVIGLTDPCLIDVTNVYAPPKGEAFAAEIKVSVPDWKAGIRYVYNDVAELRLVPASGQFTRVGVNWDGIHPDAQSRSIRLDRVGELLVDSGTCIAIDPTLSETLDYQRHVIDALSDGWVGPVNSALCSTGAGDGGYGIWTATDETGAVVAVFVNFGMDEDVERSWCSTCDNEDDYCDCAQCPGCKDYFADRDLNSDGRCPECADEEGDGN